MFRRNPIIPVLLTFILGTVVFITACDSQPQEPAGHSSAILEYRDNDLLYTFHVPTGTEALFDLRTDPGCLSNILPDNRDRGLHARKHLEEELKVQSLEELRDENNPVLQSLKGLGYI